MHVLGHKLGLLSAIGATLLSVACGGTTEGTASTAPVPDAQNDATLFDPALPSPVVDCRTRTAVNDHCVSLAGTWNGETLSITCTTGSVDQPPHGWNFTCAQSELTLALKIAIPEGLHFSHTFETGGADDQGYRLDITRSPSDTSFDRRYTGIDSLEHAAISGDVTIGANGQYAVYTARGALNAAWTDDSGKAGLNGTYAFTVPVTSCDDDAGCPGGHTCDSVGVCE